MAKGAMRSCRLLWRTLLLSACLLASAGALAQDVSVWSRLAAAYARGDADTVFTLSSRAQEPLLAPLVDYWVLSSRLPDATEAEVEAFLMKWSGTYYEDRLRNEWMRLLGKRGEWAALLRHHDLFRMQDDDAVHCWVAAARWQLKQPVDIAHAQRLWLEQRGVQPACVALMTLLYEAKRVPASLIFTKVRVAVEYGQRSDAQEAAGIISPSLGKAARQALANPARVLTKPQAWGADTREVQTWAWIRQVKRDPGRATQWRTELAKAPLSKDQRQWVQAVLATWMALNQMPDAVDVFPPDTQAPMSATHREWRLRTAIQAEHWRQLSRYVNALPGDEQALPVWRYWHAVALKRLGGASRERQALQLAKGLVQDDGYYGGLARQDWGLVKRVEPVPAVSADAMAHVQSIAGLQRARAAMALGLQREGAREWHYTIALHDSEAWSPNALRAASQWACEMALWDRCINTSLRIDGVDSLARRYPTPWRERILARSQEAGVDAAAVFGLMRQESRFVDVARSSVGASGLMQLMPATARWTAKRMGMSAQELSRWREPEVNLRLGLHYFAHVLERSSGSLPLAAASYNAGPRRVLRWLPDDPVDMVRWIESIPINETRDYVQKVVYNTWQYRAVLGLSAAPLRSLLGETAQASMESVTDSAP